ncbi:MAG: glycosyl hydrolase family 43, partial [Actinomycetota bacterium]|nr:glycosyl hydrolase family 43 [Actinomycetota bacterium]
MVNFDLENWVDHPKNPLIEPPWPSPLVGDPSVVLPGDSPDGNWHMFLNTVFGIYHYISDEGINWRKGKRIFSGWRAFVFQENGFYYLFYEEYKTPFRSKIRVRTSGDLKYWSEPQTILEPSLDWEGRIYRTNGNPCLVKKGNTYMLYYSAGQIFLRDLGFTEPRYICLALANEIFGPYEKLEK